MKKEINVKPLPKNFDELPIDKKIKVALQTGNWMVRRSNNGISHGGFEWSPIGVWTEVQDFDPSPICGQGLHGSAPEGFGYFNSDQRFEFCATDGKRIPIDDDKIKVKKAMILCIDNKALLCLEGLSIGDYLDLSGTQITELPECLSVGGSLDLSRTQITELPEGLSVGGYLNLSGTQITELPECLSVGGSLYLSGTQITELPEGLSVGGYLNLSGTRITELPECLSVGGSINLSGTQIKNIPNNLKNKIIK